MCKAAAPNHSTPNNTTSNFTKPSYTAPGYTEQNRFGHESAPKFCGRCGRQLEPGLTVCRYCAGAEESRKSHPSTKSNNNVVVIVAAAIVCIAAVLLLPRLLGGYQPSQSAQEPQTEQEPQNEQNLPTEAPEQQPRTEQSSRAKELYYAYFAENYGWDNKLEDPVYENATNKYNVFLADLTHDGEEEMLILDNTYGKEIINLTVFTCQNDSVVAIYTAETYFDPKGCALGIYTSEGESYLLICCYGMPFLSMTYDYYYRAMSFLPNGESFEIIHGELPKLYSETDELPEGYYDFVDEMDQIKRQSYMLFDPRDSYIRQSDPASVLG
ncbi:MAG: hypothetical protein ABFC56_11435 [Clostridiaceae bacterium]